MIIREVFTDALLGLAVVVVLACSAGVLVMRGADDKLHFVTPAARWSLPDPCHHPGGTRPGGGGLADWPAWPRPPR